MSTSPVSQLIQGFPQQITDGIRAAKMGLRETRMPKISRKTSHVVFCGMGGSALPGLLLRDILQKENVLQKTHLHFFIHRDYRLPVEPFHRPSVVFILSYSGNTKEALTSYIEARKRRLPTFAIASGGTLAAWAERDAIPLARIPSGIPPRFAVLLQLSALITFLAAMNLIPKRMRNDLESARKFKPARAFVPARRLAKQLRGRIPLLYAHNKDASLAYILKIQINENAKIPAFVNIFPELNHNEMNMFATLSPAQAKFHQLFAGLFLEDSKSPFEIRQRMKHTATIMRKNGLPTYHIRTGGPTALLMSVNTIAFGAWLSCELARQNAVDPLPTELIEKFKKDLA